MKISGQSMKLIVDRSITKKIIWYRVIHDLCITNDNLKKTGLSIRQRENEINVESGALP